MLGEASPCENHIDLSPAVVKPMHSAICARIRLNCAFVIRAGVVLTTRCFEATVEQAIVLDDNSRAKFFGFLR